MKGTRTGFYMMVCIQIIFLAGMFHPVTPAAAGTDELEGLLTKLKSSDVLDRASAIGRLGELGPKAASAVPLLIPLLGDRSVVKRQSGDYIVETNILTEAGKALTQIGPAAVAPLLETFGDKTVDWVIRSNAAEVLGTLHDSRAVEPLIEFLKVKDESDWDPYGFVADRVKTALEELTGQSYAKTGKVSFGEDYAKWRGWYDAGQGKKAEK